MNTEDEELKAQEVIAGLFLSLRSDLNDRFDRIEGRLQNMDEKLDVAAFERQAIRDVVDGLPTFDQVVELEKQAEATSNDMKRTQKAIVAIQETLRRATVTVVR